MAARLSTAARLQGYFSAKLALDKTAATMLARLAGGNAGHSI